jgi:hypothetical protein
MDKLISIHTDHVAKGMPSEVQAAWLHHRFTQIHPFQDGNGRLARAIASLVLVKDGLFPLVVTRDDKSTYLDALEKADAGCLKPLIDLIARLQITQFRKATALSEAILVEENVQAALGSLLKAAENIAGEKLESLKVVFKLARLIENDIRARLEEISGDVDDALKKIYFGSKVFVSGSDSNTDHYFRAQIIDNAKNHIRYFADTSEYRSWISLNMKWSRRAHLVFAIHGIGRPFNGSLICAPFLEFKDIDKKGQSMVALVPISQEGFVFFFNEDRDRLLERFRPWRENVLRIGLKELTQNL